MSRRFKPQTFFNHGKRYFRIFTLSPAEYVRSKRIARLPLVHGIMDSLRSGNLSKDEVPDTIATSGLIINACSEGLSDSLSDVYEIERSCGHKLTGYTNVTAEDRVLIPKRLRGLKNVVVWVPPESLSMAPSKWEDAVYVKEIDVKDKGLIVVEGVHLERGAFDYTFDPDLGFFVSDPSSDDCVEFHQTSFGPVFFYFNGSTISAIVMNGLRKGKIYHHVLEIIPEPT